jgi:ParB family chromosome partitioning protein
MAQFEIEEIPVELVEIGPSQSRSRKIEEGIDELATNIAKIGLLHPVTVFKTDGKYELIAGQRRFMALTKLGWTKIPAHVIGRPEDPIKAKAISFSESFMRKNLIDNDAIDACVAFYHKYGSIKAAADELGLPAHQVRKYVKFDRLPEKLKEMVNDNKMAVSVALKAVDAATQSDNSIDEPKAVILAKEMARLSSGERNRVLQEAEKTPTAKPEELIERARKPASTKKLNVELQLKNYESLRKYSTDNKNSSEEEAASELIVESLNSKGY